MSEAFIVVDRVDGSVKLVLSSKGGVVKESFSGEGTAATWESSNPAKSMNWRRRNIGIAIAKDCVAVMVESNRRPAGKCGAASKIQHDLNDLIDCSVKLLILTATLCWLRKKLCMRCKRSRTVVKQ